MMVIFLLGFFLDFLEIAVVVVPIVAPILLADPSANVTAVWFGVMVGLNIQTSFLTPPFGFSLFYLRGVAPAQCAHHANLQRCAPRSSYCNWLAWPSPVPFRPGQLSAQQNTPGLGNMHRRRVTRNCRNASKITCSPSTTFASRNCNKASIAPCNRSDMSFLPDEYQERLATKAMALAAGTFALVEDSAQRLPKLALRPTHPATGRCTSTVRRIFRNQHPQTGSDIDRPRSDNGSASAFSDNPDQQRIDEILASYRQLEIQAAATAGRRDTRRAGKTPGRRFNQRMAKA